MLTATAAETVTDFQFRYLANGDSPITQEVLKTLTPSTSQSIISAIPQNPLLVVSIDGTTVKGLVEKAVAPAEPWLESLISSLERVKRIAVSARIAPVGQSFLPVPDLLVVGETEAPEALTKSVTEVLTVALNKEGISAGMEWQDANINGIPVKAYRSPMGFGIFLTSQKNLFLAASTEAQLGASLDAIAGKGANVSSSLSPPTKETLITQPDIANFYLEFTQLASLIDNLSGMLTMFAPQGAGNGAAPFPPELSSQLRKMGTLTGTVSHQDELVTLKVSLHTVPGTS